MEAMDEGNGAVGFYAMAVFLFRTVRMVSRDQ